VSPITLVLLPGLDGTGRLFEPFLAHLPPWLRPAVVTYPTDKAHDYGALLPIVLSGLPTSGPFVLLGESFSGPLAVMAAATNPPGLRGLVLVASFVRSPAPPVLSTMAPLVRGPCVRVVPGFVRSRLLLGDRVTTELSALADGAIRSVPPRVVAQRVRSLLRVDVRLQLKALRMPLLYLQATRDRLVRQRSVDDVMSAAPSARVVEVDAPHLLLQTEPAAAAKAITAFAVSLCKDG
jgi:pimeloyl-ACP methyl ester carboxylesterase